MLLFLWCSVSVLEDDRTVSILEALTSSMVFRWMGGKNAISDELKDAEISFVAGGGSLVRLLFCFFLLLSFLSIGFDEGPDEAERIDILGSYG